MAPAHRTSPGWLAVAVGAALLAGACSAGPSGASFDVLIQGGRIYDGVQERPFVADIGIQGDRIKAIGNLDGRARKRIDAAGAVVAPGLIDVGAHCDLTFKEAGWKRYLAYVRPEWKGNHNFLTQGVTTVITGNGGQGYARTHKWLGMVDALDFGANVCHLVPYETLRRKVAGDAPAKALTAGQRASLRSRLLEELQNGAVGISTSGAEGPDRSAALEERIQAARLAAAYGGVYVTRLSSRTGAPTETGQPAIVEAIRDALEVGRLAKAAVHLSGLQLQAPWHQVSAPQILDPLAQARREGMAVTADLTPYDATEGPLSARLPPRFRTPFGVLQAYRSGQGREEIRRAAEDVLRDVPPQRIVVTSCPFQRGKEGKTLQEIARMGKQTPADAFADLACRDVAARALFFDLNEKISRRLLAQGYVMTASEAATVVRHRPALHPRFQGCFPRLLRKYAIEDQTLLLGKALRSVTSLPADTFHIRERGRIAVGCHADIVVLDLKDLAEGATYKIPNAPARGIRHVLVNGVVSVADGKPTGKRGGRALRRA